jgi:hypothetical protein
VTEEERPAPPPDERAKDGAAILPGPLPLGSGALRSMVAEARLIAPEEPPPPAED